MFLIYKIYSFYVLGSDIRFFMIKHIIKVMINMFIAVIMSNVNICVQYKTWIICVISRATCLIKVHNMMLR